MSNELRVRGEEWGGRLKSLEQLDHHDPYRLASIEDQRTNFDVRIQIAVTSTERFPYHPTQKASGYDIRGKVLVRINSRHRHR